MIHLTQDTHYSKSINVLKNIFLHGFKSLQIKVSIKKLENFIFNTFEVSLFFE